MTNFFSRFSTDATLTIILNLAVMVILTVYGGGVFIAWNDTPIYWVWLQESSVFTQASRAVAMNVAQYLNYECSTRDGQCYGPMGELFPCDAKPDDGLQCMVKGRTSYSLRVLWIVFCIWKLEIVLEFPGLGVLC